MPQEGYVVSLKIHWHEAGPLVGEESLYSFTLIGDDDGLTHERLERIPSSQAHYYEDERRWEVVPTRLALDILSSGVSNFRKQRLDLHRKRANSMNLTKAAGEIFRVITDKGHHDIEYTQVQIITFRQLAHLLTEWSEMRAEYVKLQIKQQQPEVLAKLHEEGADILIVALDLCGMHKLDVSAVPVEGQPIGVLNEMYVEVPIIIGQLADNFRKHHYLDTHLMHKLITLVWHILRRHGADPMHAIQQKMQINLSRPKRYGTGEAAS